MRYNAYRSDSCAEKCGSSVLVSMFRAYTRDPPVDLDTAGAVGAEVACAGAVGATAPAADGVDGAGAAGPHASARSAAVAVPNIRTVNSRRVSWLGLRVMGFCLLHHASSKRSC